MNPPLTKQPKSHKVYYCWSKSEYIDRHLPAEFREIGLQLTVAQLEQLAESIGEFYHRVRRQIEERKR